MKFPCTKNETSRTNITILSNCKGSLLHLGESNYPLEYQSASQSAAD